MGSSKPPVVPRNRFGYIQPTRRKGRGAVQNPSGRYESLAREPVLEAWNDDAHDAPPPLKTSVTIENPRTIITTNQSPDISYDRSINPYRGCEHGCVYCYARPTHTYMGLSAGLDFESKLFAKPNAPNLLKRELAKPKYSPTPIAMGTNTDPYQPIERNQLITRNVLRVLSECNHPVTIVTKSALITRDMDILVPMARKNLVRVALSITTLDRKLARAMEPRAATPPLRLKTIKTLTNAGIPATVMFAPVIPAVNDHEMETVLLNAKQHGASHAGYVLLRLPLEVRDTFHQWLHHVMPDRAKHTISLIRQTRGGKDYDAQWFQRRVGSGPYAQLIARRFALARKKLRLDAPRTPLNLSLFKPPAVPLPKDSIFGEYSPPHRLSDKVRRRRQKESARWRTLSSRASATSIPTILEFPSVRSNTTKLSPSASPTPTAILLSTVTTSTPSRRLCLATRGRSISFT